MASSTTPHCLGMTKSGARCRISWDLDANHLCKFHKYQKLHCQKIKSDGTRCKVYWDLDPTSGLCTWHSAPVSTTRVAEPSITTARLPPSSVAPRAPLPLEAPMLVAVHETKENPAQAVASKSSASTTRDPVSSFTTTNSESPPLWTAQFIASTGIVVVRILSEWSWQCHHEPILLTLPWWSKMDSMVARCIAWGCKLIPGVGDVVDAASPAMLTRFDAVERLVELLEEMGIENGGLYASYTAQDPTDDLLLESLLDLQRSPFHRKCNFGVSKLVRVDQDNEPPMWISLGERDQHATNAVLKRQPKPATRATMQFERVTKKLCCKHHGKVTISWHMTKDGSDEQLENGVACVGEPIHLTKLSRAELTQCLLTVEVKKKRRIRGRVIGRAVIAFSDVPHAGDENEEVTTAADIIGGQVVHLCLLAKTSGELKKT